MPTRVCHRGATLSWLLLRMAPCDLGTAARPTESCHRRTWQPNPTGSKHPFEPRQEGPPKRASLVVASLVLQSWNTVKETVHRICGKSSWGACHLLATDTPSIRSHRIAAGHTQDRATRKGTTTALLRRVSAYPRTQHKVPLTLSPAKRVQGPDAQSQPRRPASLRA